MRKLTKALIAVILMTGFVSCSNDDNEGLNVDFQKLQIVEANVPESFNYGNTYEIQVTYLRPDGCTYFQGFDVYPTDTTVREVVAVGARYAQQPCTQEVVEVTDRFLFKVIYNQPYTFRFYTGEDEAGNPQYIEAQVPVN